MEEKEDQVIIYQTDDTAGTASKSLPTIHPQQTTRPASTAEKSFGYSDLYALFRLGEAEGKLKEQISQLKKELDETRKEVVELKKDVNLFRKLRSFVDKFKKKLF